MFVQPALRLNLHNLFYFLSNVHRVICVGLGAEMIIGITFACLVVVVVVVVVVAVTAVHLRRKRPPKVPPVSKSQVCHEKDLCGS